MNPPFISILTEQTCGEACWKAKEEICRCSCGGKNHGCLTHGEQQPERTAKIDGERYRLRAVGRLEQLFPEAEKINGQQWRSIEKPLEVTDADGKKFWHQYRYHWRETEAGAPARLKSASKEQRYKWRELAGWRDASLFVYLLWERLEMPPAPTIKLVDKHTGAVLPDEEQSPNFKR